MLGHSYLTEGVGAGGVGRGDEGLEADLAHQVLVHLDRTVEPQFYLLVCRTGGKYPSETGGGRRVIETEWYFDITATSTNTEILQTKPS